MFVARPLAVLVSVTQFDYRSREPAFLAWAGLRGAVPIVLATFALSSHVSGSATIFNAVFFVTLVSTLAQGMTLEPPARRLGLTTEARPFCHPPRGIAAVAAGDRLYILVRGEARATVEDTIRRWEQGLTAGQRG